MVNIKNNKATIKIKNKIWLIIWIKMFKMQAIAYKNNQEAPIIILDFQIKILMLRYLKKSMEHLKRLYLILLKVQYFFEINHYSSIINIYYSIYNEDK